MRLAAFALAAPTTDNLQKIYSYIAKHNTSVLSTVLIIYCRIYSFLYLPKIE